MKITSKFLAFLFLSSAMLGTASAKSVPEPSTILYGKVLHRAYGNEVQLHTGQLVWTLRNQEGEEFTYQTDLQNIRDVFSYKVGIPHQALSSGLSIDSDVLPLGAGEDSYEFVSITVDGYPAAVLWSEVDYLSILQTSRAATYRIDLLVSFDLADSDGDGMPDWWEKFYGLDWQLGDAGLDPDGDGLTNLDEYLGGTDPFNDDRIPTLQTLELAVYAESNNGLWLRATDTDTPASGLTYTLTRLPGNGYLHRMSPEEGGPETALAVGDSFTQAELNAGWIAYRHSDANQMDLDFGVSLSDGVHPAAEADVSLSAFPSTPSAVGQTSESDALPFWWREENTIFEAYWNLRDNVLSGGLVESGLFYLLGRDYGWTLWDLRLETLPVELTVSGAGSHLIMGGSMADTLNGGPGDDILAGGTGHDLLAGGAGIDLFIFAEQEVDEISDFELGVDVIDIAQLFAGRSGSLDNFVQAQFDGVDTRIAIDVDGTSTYDDAVIILRGVELNQNDLHLMWSDGQLITGAVQGRAAISFLGSSASSVEEGYGTSTITLHRQGPTSLPLSVQVMYSGNAVNGVDYQILFDTVEFASGEATAEILLEPLADSDMEGNEIFTVSLLQGTQYVLGDFSQESVTIVDAKQRFNVYAVEPLTEVGGAPGIFLITRQGPINTSVTVFLGTGSSGTKDVDFAGLPGYVSFAAYQTDYAVPVTALDGGDLAQPEQSHVVDLAIKPSYGDSYLLGRDAEARIRLVSSLSDFDSWAAGTLEGDSTMTTEEKENTKTSRTGLAALIEYSFSYGVDFEDGIDSQEQAQFVPQLLLEEGGAYVEFTQRLDDPNLEYIPEVSSDMVNWNSGAAHLERVDLDLAAENAGRVRYRILNTDAAHCFVRVTVNLNK